MNPTNQPKKEGKKKKKEKRKGLEGSENNGLGKKHVFIYFRVNREATCVSSSFARQQTVRNTITSPPNNILDTPIHSFSWMLLIRPQKILKP